MTMIVSSLTHVRPMLPFAPNVTISEKPLRKSDILSNDRGQ